MPWQFATAQTSPSSPLSPCSLTDIDQDDDGLIDICDLEGLDAIRYQLDGTGYRASASADIITAGCPNDRCRGYELMRDLDFLDANSYRGGRVRQTWVSGSGWQPMGSFNPIFNNTFQGNGHAIRNLMINRPSKDDVGLFAANAGDIRDIRLLDVNIQGRTRVGALIGSNRGGFILGLNFREIIRNIYVSGSIRGVSLVGALIGVHGVSAFNHFLLIENSSATGIVLASGNTVGGLVGNNIAEIRNSQAFNTVSGADEVGGLVGASALGVRGISRITNSYATGNVTGNTSVGGLVGKAGDFNIGQGVRIFNSYATGRVEGKAQVGGLVGGTNNEVQIENSFAQGEVIGTGAEGQVGGLVGDLSNRSWIENSYTTGSVTGTNVVGGLVGDASANTRINRSYTTGNVTGITNVGGFVGLCSEASITNSHAIGDVQGDLSVGGFIGGIGANGRITNNYATGDVRGDENSNRVGGFIGSSFLGSITNSHATGDVQGGERVGGFIGHNLQNSIITNSYAIGNAQGDRKVGGFVGANGESDQDFIVGGEILDSYATGGVRGRQEIGGFAGRVFEGSIENSYALGDVRGDLEVGGFVGDEQSATITNSYWDRQTSGRRSAGGIGRTTLELQSPIEAGSTATDVYYDWDEQVWDFGTSEQYPVLKYSDGTLQPNQRLGLFRLGLPSGLIVSPSFKPEVLSYRIIDETDIRRILLIPVAANPAADIIIDSGGGFREQVSSGTTSSEILLNAVGVTAVNVEVLTLYNVPIRYTLTFNDKTFNEGERIILERISSRSVDESALRYQWTQVSGMPRLLPMAGISRAVLDVPIPETFLGKTEDNSDITIRLETNDGTRTATKDLRLTIAKADNGAVVQSDPVITRSNRTLTAPEVDLSTDPDGAGTISSYLWQRRADRNADWIDIESATVRTYRVPDAVAPYTEYRVQYGYTDGQGYTQTLISEVLVFATDIDTDDNGLIEINDLEGLDAMRHQLDGSGYRQNETVDKITTGCPTEGCTGYELTRSLDFEQGASYRSGIIRTAWTTGLGWQPIGTLETPFDASFNAKDHTIARLRIGNNASAINIGLFGVTESNAKIENVGLLDVDVSGIHGVGGLVGYKQGGSIVNSHVTGQVSGSGDFDVGGLVGWHRGGTISDSYSNITVSTVVGGAAQNVGGLVGDNDGGTITDSYALGSVNSEEKVGGLVGRNNNTGIIRRGRAEVRVNGVAAVGGLVGENSGVITNSEARERIIGGADVGGFVGWNSGTITNSYALGFVKGNNEVGGFIGNNLNGTITNSYARGDVDGANRYIGGLVGWNGRGVIINSYARGDVRGKDGVGGLVGVNLGLTNNRNIGRVSKSYAAGRVRGDRNSGGLIGENRDGHVEESYWNKTSNPTLVSAGGTSKTRVEMQTPTQPGNNTTEIYYDWNTADWDFGGTDQYPTLRYAVGPQSQPACSTAGNPDCRTPLTGQSQTDRIAASIESISDIRLLAGIVRELNVVLSLEVSDNPVKFRTSVRSSNDNIATVSIPEGGGLMRMLRIETGSDIGRSEITVLLDDGQGLADSVSSTTFVVTTKANSAPRITVAPPPESILVGESVVIKIGVMDDDFDASDRVTLTSSMVPEVSVEPRQIVGISRNTTRSITLEGVEAGTAMVEFTVTDSKGITDSGTVSVRVDERSTGSVRTDSNNKWLLTATIENVNDMAEVSYQWYRNGVAIVNVTSPTYMIPDNRIGRAGGTSYSFRLTIMDDMRRPVVVQSDSYRVANEPPVITSTTLTEMISEGDTQNIRVSASDTNYDDLMYNWSGDLRVLGNARSNPVTLSIPSDYVNAASSETIVNLEVVVSDGELSTTETVSVMVNKQNNGSATIGTSVEIGSEGTMLTAIVLSNDPDGSTSGTAMYQWQVCAGDEGRCPSADDWMNIDGATTAQYVISGFSILVENGKRFPLVLDGSLFRTEVSYTDGQGYDERVYSVGYSYGRVNVSPTISGLPSERIKLLVGTESKFDVMLDDIDDDDLLFAIQSDTPEVARLSVEGEGTTHTIKITGMSAGIATITATVNDRRGVSNSEVSEQFEVEVEGNEAPILEVIVAPQQTIGLGNTTQVVVMISDNNFDVGDSVVLEAISLNPSIVSVIPTQAEPITADTRITFMLTAEQRGAARVIFTATDSQNVSTNIDIMVRVNTPPQVLSDNVPSQVVATVGEAFELKTSEFFADADGDVLRYSAVGLPESIAITTTGTLVGVPVIGDASKNGVGLMVAVSADDGIESSTQTAFVLLIDAKPTASVRVDPDNKWLLTSMVADANGIVGVSYQWYRNGVAIENTNSSTYMIPDNRDGRATGTSYNLELTVMDSIGQSVVIQSDPYKVANEPPVIIVPVAEMINEGDTQNISISASDPNYDDLMYRWSRDDFSVLSNETSKSATLSIPPDYIKDAVSTQTILNLKVQVDDGDLSTSETVSVLVNKQNNGSARLGITRIETASRGTTLTAMVLSEDPDGGISGAVEYQWQVCEGNELGCPPENDWMDIDKASEAQYLISGSDILLEGGNRLRLVQDGSLFRAQGTYTDSQGYGEKVNSEEYVYSLRVNNAPTISGLPMRRIRLFEGTETEFDVELGDVDADDISSDLVFGIQSDKPEVAAISVEGEGTTRTIKITGIGVGIATVTATVNDNRGVSNSEVSRRFEVEVEDNEAPTVEVITASPQIIEQGNTTQVMVLVSDNNFDVGDSIALEAMSSSRSIVSVMPMQPDTITTDTIIIFTLTGVKAGTATVVFTATDSKGLIDRVSLLVLVDAKPSGSVRIEPDSSDQWLLRAISTVEDANDIVEVNYQWYREGVAIASTPSPTYTIPDNRDGRATGTSYSVELTVVDSIGQSVVVESDDSYRVANERPVITVPVAEMINEGDAQDIRVSASDPNYDNLTYRWSVDSGVLSNENSNPARLSIPPDYIKDAASMQTTLNLVVEVSDGNLSTTRAVSVLVSKQNNGSAIFWALPLDAMNELITAGLVITDPDLAISEITEYQWQVCAGTQGNCPSENNWRNIDGANEAQYIISGSSILVEGGNRFPLVQGGSVFRVKVSYTDGQDYDEEIDSFPHTHRLRINNAPTISGLPTERIKLMAGTETTFNVTINDVDTDDTPAGLMLNIESDNADVANVAIEGNGATRTIKITGVSAGITTITATVNDGRGVLNSEVSERFEMEVEGNAAPLLEVATVRRVIELGSTTQVMVLVSDNDFDMGDSVVLEVMSSSPSIVSVTPTQPDTITTNAGRTFAFTGAKAGIATIVFTVTDSERLTDSVSLLVFVDAKPTGSVRIEPDSGDKWLLRATSTIADANGIDEVNYRWYRNGVAIANATSQTYMIPDNREGRARGTSYLLELTVRDSIGQSVVIQSNSLMIANEPPVITSITVPEMISEGDTQTISADASDPNHDDLMYSWSGDDSSVLSNETSKTATLSIPQYYIRDATTTQTTLNLEVEVSDTELATTRALLVQVNQKNNGSMRLRTSIETAGGVTTLTAIVLSDDPDGGNGGAVMYQWQVCAGERGRCPSTSHWMDIDGATGLQHIISDTNILVEGGSTFSLVEDGSLFRAKVSYTDGQGYSEEVDSPVHVYTTRPVIRIRVKVFLEGSLQ